MNLKLMTTQRIENLEIDSFDDDMEMDEDDGDQNDHTIATIDQETAEFDENEVDHQIAFSKYNRISCFAHLLQLVVPQFDKVSPFQRILKKARKLVAKFNKSTKATERLLALQQKKLVSDCPTRWSSTFLLLKRLLERKETVCLVTLKLEWNGLQTSEWKKINNIVDFLQPFAEYTTLCCGEDYTSLSAVVPIIMELNCHLQEMQKQPGMGTVARVLQSEMHKRFNRYIDPSVDLFDGLHIVSTLLDPQYSLILSNEQLDEGICYLKELVKYFIDTQVQSHSKTRDEKDITTQEISKYWSLSHHLKNFGICQSWFPRKSLRIKKLHQLPLKNKKQIYSFNKERATL